MKNPIGTAAALAGVLLAGVGAAVVNTQIAPVASSDSQVVDATLVANSTPYEGAGLVTDIAAYDAVPAPVIEVVEVVVPGPVTAAPTVRHKKKARVKSASTTSSSSHEEVDEDEDEVPAFGAAFSDSADESAIEDQSFAEDEQL